MDLKERIGKYRGKHGLTQEQMAKLCNVSRYTIISIEKGTCKPTTLTSGKIEAVLSRDE